MSQAQASTWIISFKAHNASMKWSDYYPWFIDGQTEAASI